MSDRIPKNINRNIKGWKTLLPVVKLIENNTQLVNKKMKNVVNTKYDPWKHEIYEQYLTYKWINENDSVLELGANIGFVSITINSILKNKHNHFVIEPKIDVINALKFNKKKTKSKFKIFNRIISNKSVFYSIQNFQYENLLKEDLISEKIISLKSIIDKYNFKFNVIVSDSEIRIENFFMENEYILNNLNLIIFKKDNLNIYNYIKIFELFKQYNFILIEGLINNSDNPENYLHQVWIRSY
jgi:hypothetical protein